jgi:hypothetical protein
VLYIITFGFSLLVLRTIILLLLKQQTCLWKYDKHARATTLRQWTNTNRWSQELQTGFLLSLWSFTTSYQHFRVSRYAVNKDTTDLNWSPWFSATLVVSGGRWGKKFTRGIKRKHSCMQQDGEFTKTMREVWHLTFIYLRCNKRESQGVPFVLFLPHSATIQVSNSLLQQTIQFHRPKCRISAACNLRSHNATSLTSQYHRIHRRKSNNLTSELKYL